jgi:SNF2 family DNA or RNA helicase
MSDDFEALAGAGLEEVENRIEIKVEGDEGTAYGPFPVAFIKLLAALSGRKSWSGSKQVHFDANPGNVRKLRESNFSIKWDDRTQTLAKQRELENLPSQLEKVPELKTDYTPAVPYLPHMKRVLARSWERKDYAWLLEMGLCKTSIGIANAGMLFLAKRITGVLILAPKGVHRQWTEEQIPEHIDKSLDYKTILWRKKEIDKKAMRDKGKLVFLSMNIESIRTKKGYDTAEAFLKVHKGSLFILDESHTIKTPGADQTKAAVMLGTLAKYRRIMTGTPISRNLLDAWSQFFFLNPNIIGYRYQTAFKAHFCVMGGWQNETIVGQKNTEEFYTLIAPHSFRLTKKEVGFTMPKTYSKREYEMGEETERHYKSLKNTLLTELRDGTIVDAKNAMVGLLRLQQVVCGYLPTESAAEPFETISDERIKVLLDVLSQIEGKAIVWARFIEDARRITEALEALEKGTTALYRGTDTKKAEAKRNFIENKFVRWFVANPASAGTGTDGLQKVCQNAVYYSNSFNALDRWQSEDRIDRFGMIGPASFVDIIATRSIDRPILANLRAKKDMSDLTLDQIRMALIQE